MSQFFINRPIFAWVVAILLFLAGLLSLQSLPISAYPSVAAPQITVNAIYPGASAKVIEDTVTSVIEEQMNGIEGLKYMSATSSSTGTATLTLVFDIGTDIDLAAVDVQNRLKEVEPKLPNMVKQQGVAIDKTRPDYLMIVALSSPKGTKTRTDMSDYIESQLIGEIRRIKGVGFAQLFGAKYAMRVWLDPVKMTSYKITPVEVVSAISAQNVQLATGEIGSQPAPPDQQTNITVLVPSVLNNVEQFKDIILRTNNDGAIVRLSDVADVERGAESYSFRVTLDGKESTAMGIKLTNSGNALETASLIKEKMTELEKSFPSDVEWDVPYDTSLFVQSSIDEVVKTLVEAIILVVIIMFIFLQGWRTTLIPLIVVPISLIGTAIVLHLFGFSLNMLTLFGMVLAIGIVVDDAIIVVENIERLIHEENLSPYEASKKGMKQISGAIIGTTAVLVSVFIPMAFFGGSVGQIYKQFSITISTSILISGFLALTLSPAIAQGLLKSRAEEHAPIAPFRVFNRCLEALTNAYLWFVDKVISGKGLVVTLIIFVLIVSIDYKRFSSMPTGFVPEEDQGFIVASVLLPAGATFDRVKKLTDRMNLWLHDQEEIDKVITIQGFSAMGNGQNNAMSFIKLKTWDERKKMRSAKELVKDSGAEFAKYTEDGMAFSFNFPPIPGMGTELGFEFWLKNQNNLNDGIFMGSMMQLIGDTMKTGKVQTIRPNILPPAPQVMIDVNREKANTLGIDMATLNNTLQLALGSGYVNDYIDNGNVRQVWVQADAQTRANLDGIMSLQVLNKSGGLVDLSEIASAKFISGPVKLDRFNGSSAVKITGAPKQGESSGDVINTLKGFADKLPKGITYSWSGQSLEEIESGSQIVLLFSLSILVIFLALSALYESWSVPVAVMLVVPLGVLGCLVGTWVSGDPNDVYFKIGIITIIGLSAKNAILIVEFALEAQIEGKGLVESVTEACRLRFRPILMTSCAFILGVIPLIFAGGAGAASRQAIGVAVFSGMVATTLLAILFVPTFYMVVRKFFPYKLSKFDLAELAKKNAKNIEAINNAKHNSEV